VFSLHGRCLLAEKDKYGWICSFLVRSTGHPCDVPSPATMKALTAFFVLAIAFSGLSGEVQVYNQSTNTVTASVDAVSLEIPGGGQGRLVFSTNGTFSVVGILTNAVTSDKNWVAWVAADGSATLSEGTQLGVGLWAYFAGGMGVGLMFYGFGWQMRLVRAIGSARDV